MALEPPPLISREPPRSRRRRRQQQQSSCCCCLLVAVSVVFVIIAWRGPLISLLKRNHADQKAASADFPLEITTDAPAYLRYNLVRLEATLVDSKRQPRTTPRPPQVTISHEGETVRTVGNVEQLELRYDRANGKYAMTWPIPWNATPGTYVAEAKVPLTDLEGWGWETPEQKKERLRLERRNEQTKERPPTGTGYCVARARFVVNARPLAQIPPGTCIATWEPDFRASNITRPDGTVGDWTAMFDWCKYMGADTFWCRGAVTEAYQNTLTDQMPFNNYTISQLPRIAAEAHRQGLRFGTWAAAYATYPEWTNHNKPAYQFAKDISRTTGAVRELDFISLLEPKRVTHLAQFFAQIQQDPNVDYVGLDYMRADSGGYEMTDRFTSEMPVKLPKGFAQWTQKQRWAYMARKVEGEWQTDPSFYDAWSWWKAHQVAGNLRDIIDQAQLRKPLWIFVLSWWHGKQHGQDPVMFSDAGASLQAPMLYQVPNRDHFDTMVRDWNEYVTYGDVNLAPGDQVDDRWHQRTRRPAAPEELYDRMVTGHRKYLRNGLSVGGFWHDISRAAVSGDRGPYPGTEWALAGGAAFTTIRNDWRVYPMTAELTVPPTGPLGGTVQATLTLSNVVKTHVRRINIQMMKTSGIEPVEATKAVQSLGAGETITVPLTVKLKGPNAARANRFMVCAKVTWPDEDYGKTVRRDLPRMMLVMKYVQGK